MPGPILRNVVVRYFGTPDLAEGSVNEPRERDEHGLHFNEKWLYRHPLRDPAGAAERMHLLAPLRLRRLGHPHKQRWRVAEGRPAP